MARRRTAKRTASSGVGCGTIAVVLLICVGCGMIGGGKDGNNTAATAVAQATATPLAIAHALTSTPAPIATAAPTLTPTPRLAPTPTAAPPRSGRVSDASGLCWVTLPTGFAEDVPGEGYFPAGDRSAYVMLDGPLGLEITDTPDAIAAAAAAWLTESLVGYPRRTPVRPRTPRTSPSRPRRRRASPDMARSWRAASTASPAP